MGIWKWIAMMQALSYAMYFAALEPEHRWAWLIGAVMWSIIAIYLVTEYRPKPKEELEDNLLQFDDEPEIPIMVQDVHITPGHVDMIMQHPAFAIIVMEMVEYFAKTGAENYLELDFHHPDEGKFTMTIQKKLGKSPGEINRIMRTSLEEVVNLRGGSADYRADYAFSTARKALKEVGYLDA